MKKAPFDESIDLTRRRLLLGLAAIPFFLNSAWASTPKNPDVVVIGAGAAGLTDLDGETPLGYAPRRL